MEARRSRICGVVVTHAIVMLVGIVYSLLNVRSPAPPVVALVGLLGILVGEQIIPLARHMLLNRALI